MVKTRDTSGRYASFDDGETTFSVCSTSDRRTARRRRMSKSCDQRQWQLTSSALGRASQSQGPATFSAQVKIGDVAISWLQRRRA